MAEKICPMMSRSVDVGNADENSYDMYYIHCQKEGCALWVEEQSQDMINKGSSNIETIVIPAHCGLIRR